jgi:hypothetical protein
VGQGLLQGALNEKWEIMEKSLGLRKWWGNNVE